MVLPTFRKTLIALAVLASQPALATTLNLTGSPTVVTGPDPFDEPLILTGQASGTEYAVNLDAPLSSFPINQVGDVINRADLSVNADDGSALRFSDYSSLFFTQMVGSLTNEGTLSSQGRHSAGLHIGGTQISIFDAVMIDGSVANTGSIQVDGTGAAGIRLSGLTWIQGDLNNSGTIAANGDNAAGISTDGLSLISGNLLNTGSITTSGSQSSAIHLNALDLSGYLNNQGTLQSNGDNSAALRVSNGSSSHSLINSSSGKILASGTASRGISVEQGSYLAGSNPIAVENMGLIQVEGTDSIGVFVDHPANVQILINQGDIRAIGSNSRGIVIGSGYPTDPSAGEDRLQLISDGTITADGVAIDISASPDNDTSPYPWTQVDVWGSVTGGTAAVRGKGNANIFVENGEIHGDLLGIQQLYANGGLIDSAHIEAQRFAIGHVELAQAHSQLTGNLELLGNSALDLNLSRQTDNQRAILAVSGNATFDFHDEIRLQATAQDFRLAGPRQYVLISANQVIDQAAAWEYGLSVTSLSDLLRVYSYQVSDTQVTAMVGGISTQEAVDYLRAEGASNHVLPAYGMFYGNVVSQLDDSDPVFETFTSSNHQQLLALANQLAPDVSGALNQSQSSNLNLLGSTFQQRGNSQRQGLSAGDGLSETGAWLQVLNSDANQGSRSGTPGYDADSQGILVGADGKLNESTTLGLAYSFIDSDVHSAGNKTESAAQALSLYGNWAQNAWFADASLTYGQADNDSRRTISSTRAKANFDSQLLGAELLGGYRFMPQPGLQLEPRVGARYNRVDIDSYHEKGSSAALTVSAQRYEVGELGAGLRLASELSLGAGQLKPELTLMAWHDLIADQVSSNSAFLAGGSAFVTNGSAPTRDSYQANIGVDYELGAITLGLGYDYLGKADYSADTFNAKVRYDF